MSIESRFRALSSGYRRTAIAAVALLVLAVAQRAWLFVPAALALLAWVAWRNRPPAEKELRPFAMPPAYRSLIEAMARPIDPTPRRVLPLDEKSVGMATVATTPEDLARLTSDRPPGWPWATFTSVLVQRRNAVLPRLRAVAGGYHPAPGLPPITDLQYANIAVETLNSTLDVVAQLEQFMRSPAFSGAFGTNDNDADADAITGIAHRLMDYHAALLQQAERCLQTPVARDTITFVTDTGSLALCPLASFERFIPTMCDRVGQAQDLLPYAEPGSVVALDDVELVIDLPDGLAERVGEHVRNALT